LILRLDSSNLKKALGIFSNLGYRPRAPVELYDFAEEPIRRQWIQEKGMLVFSLYNPSSPLMTLDLFVEYPLPYEDLMRDSVVKDLDGTPVRVCSIEHLIKMKEKAGRPKDKEDCRILRLIQNGK